MNEAAPVNIQHRVQGTEPCILLLTDIERLWRSYGEERRIGESAR